MEDHAPCVALPSSMSLFLNNQWFSDCYIRNDVQDWAERWVSDLTSNQPQRQHKSALSYPQFPSEHTASLCEALWRAVSKSIGQGCAELKPVREQFEETTCHTCEDEKQRNHLQNVTFSLPSSWERARDTKRERKRGEKWVPDGS